MDPSSKQAKGEGARPSPRTPALNLAVAERLQRIARVPRALFLPRRMRRFAALFGLGPTDRIIDVGGYLHFWRFISGFEPDVLVVNLEREEMAQGRMRKIYGDARDLPYPDGAFDVAYSNSVVEHVGDWADQQAFAQELRRVAPRYYVQTPSHGFPIEPHLMAPFIHWLPRRWRPALVRYCSIYGWVVRPSLDEARAYLDSIRLLSEAELRELFPDAELIRERCLGLTKSWIAMRR